MANALKTYRLKNKMTIAQLGAVLGVSNATISDWENYKKYPRLDALLAIIKVTKGKVTANDFLPPSESN